MGGLTQDYCTPRVSDLVLDFVIFGRRSFGLSDCMPREVLDFRIWDWLLRDFGTDAGLALGLSDLAKAF